MPYSSLREPFTSLGDDVVVFEVQQNSDVTFRLYDWGHIDAKTGRAAATPSRSGACQY